jgi:hypothetical protein
LATGALDAAAARASDDEEGDDDDMTELVFFLVSKTRPRALGGQRRSRLAARNAHAQTNGSARWLWF